MDEETRCYPHSYIIIHARVLRIATSLHSELDCIRSNHMSSLTHTKSRHDTCLVVTCPTRGTSERSQILGGLVELGPVCIPRQTRATMRDRDVSANPRAGVSGASGHDIYKRSQWLPW